MKKLAIATLVAVSVAAYAGDSVTVEGQHINNNQAAAQQQYVLGVKKDFGSFAGDVAFQNAQTEGTNALSTRLEAGATVTGPVGLYARAAIGEKFTNTTDFKYYSVEPGITAPIGYGLTAKVGYRWRSAIDSANADQTHTTRYALSYALNKTDAIAVKYDRVKGDSDQKVVAVAYTVGF
jgi:hypothetical protein